MQEVVLSDNKLTQVDVACPPIDLTVGSLASAPSWSRPKGIDAETWRACLAASCNSRDLSPSQFAGSSVQEPWDLFMVSLNDMFRRAFRSLHEKGLVEGHDFRSRVRGSIPKGDLPRWKCVTCSRTKNTSAKGAMRILNSQAAGASLRAPKTA